MKKQIPKWLTSVILLWACVSSAAMAQGDYFVATTGSDLTGDGSMANPWATITHALENVPDGSTVVVKSGEYLGRVYLRGHFSTGVLVKAEVPYQTYLRNNDRVVTTYDGCSGITLQGFNIAHSEPDSGALVIHIDGGGLAAQVYNLILRDNILNNSYNNDILKINNNARDILVEGNIFYNQAGSDEHIDVNSVTGVIIQDNIFFNDFAADQRSDSDTSSFIVIKDSNQGSDEQWGSQEITVRRNIFAHWEGSSGQGFIRAGEDGQSFYEAQDILIENNLLLGNNTQEIRSPFQLMNVYSVTIRANTVVGDMPAKEFGARIFTYGDNAPVNDQIHLYNNIWVDPAGTMGDTFNRGNNTTNLAFDNNLFWNNGNTFPTSGESIIEVTDDGHRIVADPLLGNQSGLVLPRWQQDTAQLADGSATIREAFEKLVVNYGTPASGSPVVNAANPEYAPVEDILGHFRRVPDIGAVELPEVANHFLYLPLVIKPSNS